MQISESTQNYKILFNRIPASVFIVSTEDATIKDINKESLRLYGYTKDELIGSHITKIDKCISDDNIKKVTEVLHKDTEATFETVHTTKDNQELNVMVRISKITVNNKECFLAVHTDITDQIKVNKELKKHKEALESVVKIQKELISNSDFNTIINNMLRVMCISLDVERAYIFKNSILNGKLVCSQEFEYAQEGIQSQLHNQYLQNMVYDDFVPRWEEELSSNNTIEGLVKDLPENEREILEDQSIKSILVMPIFNRGKWTGFIGFDDCTTPRVWSELEKEMLSTVVNSYVDAKDKYEYSKSLQEKIDTQIEYIRSKDKILLQQSKQAQMGEMISMIAHQWRQPLNTISATAISLSISSEMDMLEKEKVKENTQIIQDQCQKMSSTINTFMSFVKPTKEQKPFKLINSIESIMKIMSTQLTNHNIHVNIKSTNDNISVVGYEDLLEQVLLNLLSNSRDAFEELEMSDKYINITITLEDDKPVIIIEDNAGGIDENLKDKLFNPYFTTKEQGKGTGLGLYISLDIMKKSFHGNLTHTNVPNGSMFKIIFG